MGVGVKGPAKPIQVTMATELRTCEFQEIAKNLKQLGMIFFFPLPFTKRLEMHVEGHFLAQFAFSVGILLVILHGGSKDTLTELSEVMTK